MKKVLLSLLGVLLALPALARDFTYKSNGQTLTYTVIDEEAKTCKPKIGSYDWSQYTGIPGNNVSGNLVIPEFAVDNSISYKVVEISDFSFSGCKNLVSVEIPKSVIKIDESAFRDCSALKSVSIPESVTTIGNNVFRDCSALTSIPIPESVDSIGNYAFFKCDALKKAEFASIESLCKIKFGRSYANPIRFAHNLWIAGKEIKGHLVIPKSVTGIGNDAFSSCYGLTSVSIPESVTEIGECAFENCNNLTSISIPGSVTEIGEGAFGYCSSLTSVYYLAEHPVEFTNTLIFGSEIYNKATLYVFKEALPTCKYIDPWRRFLKISEYSNDFTYEYKGQTLTYTIVDEDAKTCRTKAGYYDDYDDMIFAGNNISGDLVIPEFAFDGTEPYKVVEISDFSFSMYGSLISVELPNSITKIGHSAFRECINLTSVTIPESTVSIDDFAFFGAIRLTSIELPNSISEIGNAAFRECIGLTSIEIPKSVTFIGAAAFLDCMGLSSVYYLADNPIEGNQDIFDENIYNTVKLYVLDDAFSRCLEIDPWKNFLNIDVYYSGIKDITIDNDAPCEVYNLRGIRVADRIGNLPAGIYIIRQGNNAKKIVVD